MLSVMYAKCHVCRVSCMLSAMYAECLKKPFMVNAIMLSVVKLSVGELITSTTIFSSHKMTNTARAILNETVVAGGVIIHQYAHRA
jgi:hypothetical protein